MTDLPSDNNLGTNVTWRQRAAYNAMRAVGKRYSRCSQAPRKLTEGRFLALMRKKQPIIFRQYSTVPSWACLDTLRCLASEEGKFPHRRYVAFTGSSSGHLRLTQGKCHRAKVYLEEFLDDTTLDYLLGVHGDINGACPLQRHPDDECEPPLSRDVSKLVILEWFARWWGTEYDHQQFFMAKRYCFTDLHYDSYHNFYVCVWNQTVDISPTQHIKVATTTTVWALHKRVGHRSSSGTIRIMSHDERLSFHQHRSTSW